MSGSRPAPIEAAEARRWRPGRSGPPEARLIPEEWPMRLSVALARCFRRRGRGLIPRTALKLLGRQATTVSTPWGGRFRARRGDPAFLLGVCYEPLETAVVWRLLEPGMTVIDVGANRGWYTVLAAHRVGSKGRVIALEPGRRALALLEENLALNPFCANTTVLELAASSDGGDATFVDEQDISLSHLAAEHVPGRGRTVRQARLDTVIEQLGLDRVDFVKVDVEGAEAQVLSGLRATLTGPEAPILLFEGLDRNLRPYGQTVEGLVEYLADLSNGSYRVEFLCHRHGCPESPDQACRDASQNLLALPAGHGGASLRSLFAPG